MNYAASHPISVQETLWSVRILLNESLLSGVSVSTGCPKNGFRRFSRHYKHPSKQHSFWTPCNSNPSGVCVWLESRDFHPLFPFFPLRARKKAPPPWSPSRAVRERFIGQPNWSMEAIDGTSLWQQEWRGDRTFASPTPSRRTQTSPRVRFQKGSERAPKREWCRNSHHFWALFPPAKAIGLFCLHSVPFFLVLFLFQVSVSS